MEISQKQFEILSFLYGTDKWISPKDIPNCEKEIILDLRKKALFSIKVINGEECYRLNEVGRAIVEKIVAKNKREKREEIKTNVALFLSTLAIILEILRFLFDYIRK